MWVVPAFDIEIDRAPITSDTLSLIANIKASKIKRALAIVTRASSPSHKRDRLIKDHAQGILTGFAISGTYSPPSSIKSQSY